jgi:CheY-like chemotaxis protein
MCIARPFLALSRTHCDDVCAANTLSMNKTLLYVEDDSADVIVVRKALLGSNIPFNLYVVREGPTAIDYMDGKGIYSDRERFPLPDVMLLNVRPETKRPYDVLEDVRDEKRFRNLPILVQSNGFRAGDVKDATESGATACFRKTADCGKLLEFLQAKVKGYAMREACAARDRSVRASA